MDSGTGVNNGKRTVDEAASDEHTGIGSGIVIGSKAKRWGGVGGGGGVPPTPHWGVGNGKLKERSIIAVRSTPPEVDLSEGVGSDPIFRDWEWKAKRSGVSIGNQREDMEGTEIGNGIVIGS